MSGTNLPEVGASLNISLKGIDKCESQVDRLGDKLDALQDKPVEVRLKASDKEVRKLTDSVDAAIEGISKRIAAIGNVTPDMSGTRKELERTLNPGVVDAWVNTLTGGLKTAAAASRQTGQQISTSWDKAKQSIVSALSSVDTIKKPSDKLAVIAQASKVAEEYRKMALNIDKSLADVESRAAAYSAKINNHLLGAVSGGARPTSSALKDLNSFNKTVAAKLGAGAPTAVEAPDVSGFRNVAAALGEVKEAAKAAEHSITGMNAGIIGVLGESIAGGVADGAKAAKGLNADLERTMEMSSAMANALISDSRSVAKDGYGLVRSELHKGLALLTTMAAKGSTFSTMFGEDVMGGIVRVREGVAAVAEARKALAVTLSQSESSDSEIDTIKNIEVNKADVLQDTKALIMAERELVQARQASSATLLESMSSAIQAQKLFTDGKHVDLSLENKLVERVNERKMAIQGAVSAIASGQKVSENVAIVERALVDIARSKGNLEEQHVQRQMKSVDTSKKALENALRMLSAQKKIATTMGGRFVNAEKTMLADAKDDLSYAARTGEPKQVSAALSGLKAVNLAIAKLNTEEAFTAALTDIATAIDGGVVPAYGRAIAAATEYGALMKRNGTASANTMRLMTAAIGREKARLSSAPPARNMAELMQRENSVNMLEALRMATVNTGGRASPSGASNAAKELIAEQRAIIAADRERLQVTQSISDAQMKLMTLYQYSSDIIGNEAKLFNVAKEAHKAGIPIEERLLQLAKDKGALANNLYNDLVATDNLMGQVVATNQTQLGQYRHMADTWRMIGALIKQSGKDSMTLKSKDGNTTRISVGGAAKKAEKYDASALMIEKEMAADKLRNQRAVDVKALLDSRYAAQSKIVELANKANAASTQENFSLTELTKLIQAATEAKRDGVRASQADVNMTELRESAMRNALVQERTLSAIMQDGNALMQERVYAAQLLDDLYSKMGTALGKGENLSVTPRGFSKPVDVNADYITAGKQRAADFAATQADTPQDTAAFKTIKEAAANAEKLAQSTDAAAKLEHKYAEEVERARTALLAGVQPMENFLAMRKAIMEAAAAGVKLDAQDLAILEKTRDVQAAIAAQVQTSLSAGEASSDKVMAAYTAKSVQPQMAFLNETGFDTSGLEKQLGRVKNLAGDALEGSFAAAQKHAADTTSEVSKLLTALKYTSAEVDTQGEAYAQNAAYINRITSSLEKMRKSEVAILDNAEAMNSMTEQDIAAQVQRVNVLERVKAAFDRIRAAQGTIDTNLGNIGNFNITNTLTKEGVAEVSKAAKGNKTNDEFVRVAKGANDLKAAIAAAVSAISDLPEASRGAFKTVEDGLRGMGTTAETAAKGLGKLSGTHERLARNDSGANIFDRFRIYWFMQLRAFWEMYTNIGQLITTLATYNQMLATTRAVTQGTARDMQSMSSTYSDIARTVPLALTSIAGAALEVAKAGFNVKQTETIIRSASKLAVATQDDIKTVADLQAVIIHAWHADVNDIDKISDQLFNAVAKSRADIQGLASAIGYVAGIAPQANVPLDHALAVMSILTNAGLTMSKAGTYTRQFLNDLMNPSAKLRGVIANLGLSVQDIDPRLNNLESIFKTLASSGMNVADAFDGMSIRAASAFSVMLKNSNVVQAYIDDINQAGAVNEAFAVSSDTVKSSFTKMVNAIVILGDTLAKPFGDSTSGLINGIGSLVNTLTAAASAIGERMPWISEAIPVFLQLGAGIVGVRIAWALLSKLFAAGLALGGITKLLQALRVGKTLLAANTLNATRFATVLSFIGKNPAMLAVVAAVTAVVYALGKATSEAEKFAKQVEALKENLEDIRTSSEKGFGLAVEVQEASTLTGRMTAAKQELEANAAMDTQAKRGVGRATMQAMASYARSSSDTALRGIGEQMAKAIPAAGASEDSMLTALGKFVDLYNAAIGRTKELKVASNDWASDHAKLVDKAANKMDAYADRVSASADKMREGPNFGERVALWASQPSYSRLFSNPAAKVTAESQQEKTRGELFDIFRNVTGQTSGMGVEGNALGNYISGFTGMSLRLTANMTDFKKQTTYVSRQLEDMGLSLTTAEKEQLNLVNSAKEYAAVLKEILSSRAEQTSNIMRSGSFSPKEIEDMKKEIAQTANAIQTMYGRYASTEEQLTATKRTVDIGQRTLGAARSVGADTDPVTRDAFQALEKLLKHYADWERNSKVNIANVKDMMSRDPSQVDIADREAFNKSMADTMRGEVEQITQKMASSAARGAYAQVFGLGGAGDAVLATQEKAIGEELAAQIAQMQILGKNDPLRAMNPEVMKAFNKALEDYVKMVLNKEDGSTPLEKFNRFASGLQSDVRAAGGTQDASPRGLAKMTDFSRTFTADMSSRTQMDTFDTLDEYIAKLREARQEFAQAGDLIDPKDSANISKQLLSGQRSVSKLGAEMTKTRRTALNATTAFSVAAASVGTFRGAINALDMRSLELDEVNAKLEEFEARLDAAGEASADAKDTIESLGKQMTALANLPDGNIESLNVMRDASGSLSSNLDTIRQQLKSVTGELKNANREMLTLRLSAATDALEFKKNYREASLAGTYFGGRQFKMGQSSINDQRSFIRDNANLMDASTMRDNLKSLRESLLNFAKDNPNQPLSQEYLAEARRLNAGVQELYAKELAVKNAEAAALSNFQQKLMSNTDTIVSVLTEIRAAIGKEQGKVADMAVPPLPPIQRRSSRALGHDVGALTARYESGGDPSKIGYDKGGGTSYGKYQIATNTGTFDNFLKFLQSFDKELGDLLVNTAQAKTRQSTGEVDAPVRWNTKNKESTEPTIQAWQEVTKNNSSRMAVAQEEFMLRTHYEPAVRTFEQAAGIMANDVPLIIRQALHSTGTQHGALDSAKSGRGQGPIVRGAVSASKQGDGSLDYKKFLEALYAGRAEKHPATADRYSRELADALNALGSSGAQPAADALGKAAVAATSLTGALAEYQRAEQLAADRQAELEKVRAATGSESPETKQLKAEVEQTKQALAVLNAAISAAASGMPVAAQPKDTKPAVKGTMPLVTGKALGVPALNTAVTSSTSKVDSANAELRRATADLGASVKNIGAGMSDSVTTVTRAQRGFKAIAEDYLIANWQNDTADAYAYELFTTQVETMKQGLTNIMTTSVRDAINGTSDWEDAGWNMIYALIDNWIAGLMNNMMNAMMASMIGKTAVGGWAATAGNGFVAPGGFAHTGGLISRHTGGVINDIINSPNISRFASGGLVRKGNKQRDSTLAALTKGEFVVQEPTVRKLGLNFMQALNGGNLGTLRDMIGVSATRQYDTSSSFTSTNAQSTVAQSNSPVARPSAKDRGISIVNITDPTQFERFVASPRGAKMIRNVAGSGPKKYTHRSG